jgi:hypothetical protein
VISGKQKKDNRTGRNLPPKHRKGQNACQERPKGRG